MFEKMKITEQVYEGKSPSKEIIRADANLDSKSGIKWRRSHLAYQPREGPCWQAQDKKRSLFNQEDNEFRKNIFVSWPRTFL